MAIAGPIFVASVAILVRVPGDLRETRVPLPERAGMVVGPGMRSILPGHIIFGLFQTG